MKRKYLALAAVVFSAACVTARAESTLSMPAYERSALSGRLFDGIQTHVPVANGHVFVLAKDGVTILGHARTRAGTGRDTGGFQIADLPATGDALLVAFHPKYPSAMFAEEVALAGKYMSLGKIYTVTVQHDSGGASGILGLAPWIEGEIRASQWEKQSADLAEKLIQRLSEENQDSLPSKYDQPTYVKAHASKNLRVLLSDDFESVQLGTFPSQTGWEVKWNGADENYVTKDPLYRYGKSFHLRGRSGWSACVINSSFDPVQRIAVECDVLGMGDNGGVGLRSYNEAQWGTTYSSVSFNNGIISAGAYGEGRTLQSYSAGKWYHLKFIFDNDARTTQAWIDGKPFAPIKGNQGGQGYSSLEIHSGHGGSSFYFDNIRVYEAE